MTKLIVDFRNFADVPRKPAEQYWKCSDKTTHSYKVRPSCKYGL